MATTVVGTGTDVGVGALRSALKKARWRLIPLLSVCYLVAYMDRVNISFAAESMNRDLHFTAKIYGLGAGLFFLSYALCEIPSNRLLLKFGARRWIARIMVTWGLLAGAMILVHTPWSFYVMRLLLGVAEAGFFPGAIYYLSLWFPKAQRSQSISMYYIAFPLSNVVMGGLAGVLLKQNGRLGLAGWQWLFLVEALPAIALGVIVWFALPDGPAKAKWLTEEERGALDVELGGEAARLSEAEATRDHGSHLRRAFRSPYVWGLGLFNFFTLGSNYAVAFSLPLVLRGAIGWSPGQVGGMVAVFGIVSAAAMLLNGRRSDRKRERRFHVVVPVVTMALALLAAGLLHLSGWGAVGALLVASASYCAMQGPMLSTYASVLSGEAAAIAIATINMCSITGGFVGPYWMGWMREVSGGYAVGIGALCVPCLLGAVLMMVMMRRLDPKQV